MYIYFLVSPYNSAFDNFFLIIGSNQNYCLVQYSTRYFIGTYAYIRTTKPSLSLPKRYFVKVHFDIQTYVHKYIPVGISTLHQSCAKRFNSWRAHVESNCYTVSRWYILLIIYLHITQLLNISTHHQFDNLWLLAMISSQCKLPKHFLSAHSKLSWTSIFRCYI